METVRLEGLHKVKSINQGNAYGSRRPFITDTKPALRPLFIPPKKGDEEKKENEKGKGKRHATSKGLGWYGKCITPDDRIIDLLTTGSSNKRSTTRLLFHSYSRLFYMIYKTSPSIKIITYTPTFFFFFQSCFRNEWNRLLTFLRPTYSRFIASSTAK